MNENCGVEDPPIVIGVPAPGEAKASTVMVSALAKLTKLPADRKSASSVAARNLLAFDFMPHSVHLFEQCGSRFPRSPKTLKARWRFGTSVFSQRAYNEERGEPQQ